MVSKAIAGCVGTIAAPRREGARAWPALRSLLGVQGFLRLCLGNGLAFSGLRLQNIALAWLVLEMTGSKLVLGVVVGVPALGVIGASLLGGVLADSRHARNGLRWTRLAMAASAIFGGLLVTTGQVEIGLLMVVALVTSFATAVDMPVGRTLIFDAVGRERALASMAMGTMVSNLCAVAGPLVVGVLMSRFGVDVALYAVGASYAAAATLVPPMAAGVAGHERLNPLHEVRAGFGYLRDAPCVAWLVSLFFLVPFAGMYFAMVPVYAHEVLDAGPAGLGVLMAAWGAGTAIGSGYLVLNSQMRRRGARVTGFGLAFGVSVIAFAASGSIVVSVLLAFVSGVIGMLWQNTLSAMVQTAAAPDMKGRTIGIGTMGIQLMSVGWLFAGVMSSLAGPVVTVAFAGAAFAGLSLVVFVRSADVRAID